MIFIPNCVPEKQEDKAHQHILEQVIEEETTKLINDLLQD